MLPYIYVIRWPLDGLMYPPYVTMRMYTVSAFLTYPSIFLRISTAQLSAGCCYRLKKADRRGVSHLTKYIQPTFPPPPPKRTPTLNRYPRPTQKPKNRINQSIQPRPLKALHNSSPSRVKIAYGRSNGRPLASFNRITLPAAEYPLLDVLSVLIRLRELRLG